MFNPIIIVLLGWCWQKPIFNEIKCEIILLFELMLFVCMRTKICSEVYANPI